MPTRAALLGPWCDLPKDILPCHLSGSCISCANSNKASRRLHRGVRTRTIRPAILPVNSGSRAFEPWFGYAGAGKDLRALSISSFLWWESSSTQLSNGPALQRCTSPSIAARCCERLRIQLQLAKITCYFLGLAKFDLQFIQLL